MGPGGAAPTDGAALVSLTDFRVRRFRDLLPVIRAGLRIRRTWDELDGCAGSVGFTLWVRPGSTAGSRAA